MPRLPRDVLVHTSIENAEHNRCVDLFVRPDGTHGFEEFRRDPEDAGAWTPISYFAAISYATQAEAHAAAQRAVPWLR
jgi:hypothetical protein